MYSVSTNILSPISGAGAAAAAPAFPPKIKVFRKKYRLYTGAFHKKGEPAVIDGTGGARQPVAAEGGRGGAKLV